MFKVRTRSKNKTRFLTKCLNYAFIVMLIILLSFTSGCGGKKTQKGPPPSVTDAYIYVHGNICKGVFVKFYSDPGKLDSWLGVSCGASQEGTIYRADSRISVDEVRNLPYEWYSKDYNAPGDSCKDLKLYRKDDSLKVPYDVICLHGNWYGCAGLTSSGGGGPGDSFICVYESGDREKPSKAYRCNEYLHRWEEADTSICPQDEVGDLCTDGRDNDYDGAIDCNDSDCEEYCGEIVARSCDPSHPEDEGKIHPDDYSLCAYDRSGTLQWIDMAIQDLILRLGDCADVLFSPLPSGPSYGNWYACVNERSRCRPLGLFTSTPAETPQYRGKIASQGSIISGTNMEALCKEGFFYYCGDANSESTSGIKVQYAQYVDVDAINKRFFCGREGFVDDLDSPGYEELCNDAGFVFTGTKCCGDDNTSYTSRPEVYEDPGGIGVCIYSNFYANTQTFGNDHYLVLNGEVYQCGEIGIAKKSVPPHSSSIPSHPSPGPAPTPPTPSYRCTDSDGGRNYNVSGTASGYFEGSYRLYNVADSCINEYLLREYYCEDDYLKSEIISCRERCEDGVCIGGGMPKGGRVK